MYLNRYLITMTLMVGWLLFILLLLGKDNNMQEDKIIYGITIGDFQSKSQDLLNRELTKEEIELCMRKFEIHDWSDSVEFFIIERFKGVIL